MKREIQAGAPLRVGLLCSLTGPLAPVERTLMAGAVLAAERVNAAGGLAGRPIELVVEDYASDTMQATRGMRRLLTDGSVRIVLGGYTSASRVAMLPVLGRHDGLLLYPTYYEGFEQDERTIYLGGVPDQYLVQYVRWVLEHLGDRVFLLGSDYVYPRTAAAIVAAVVEAHDGTLVADRYVPLGRTSFDDVLSEIERLRPSVVISNLVGADSVPAFYRAFRRAGHTAATLPIAATVTTELDLRLMGPVNAAGHYMTGTYFSSLENACNREYVRAMMRRHGPDTVMHAAQVAFYNGIHLLALAAERVTDLDSVHEWRAALVGTCFEGNPEGAPVTVCANRHTVHPAYIGRADAQLRYEILHELPARHPDPYPTVLVGSASTSPE